MADTDTCSSDSANPSHFSGINEMVRSVDLEGRRIKLVTDYEFGKTWGWATISGRTTSTRGTDRVWMDVTNRRDRSTWDQCGPFTVDVDGTIGFTRAEVADLDNPNRAFRACGDVLVNGRRKLACTSWW